MNSDSLASQASNTGRLQAAPSRKGCFVKGDPRINRKGRPKSFDQIRQLAVELANERVKGTRAIRALLKDWRDSGDVAKQRAFMEYAFGKVPDKIEASGLENRTVITLHYAHERRQDTREPVIDLATTAKRLNGTT